MLDGGTAIGGGRKGVRPSRGAGSGSGGGTSYINGGNSLTGRGRRNGGGGSCTCSSASGTGGGGGDPSGAHSGGAAGDGSGGAVADGGRECNSASCTRGVKQGLKRWKTTGGGSGGGGGSLANPGGDCSAWSLEELAESFETDRLGRAWRGDDGVGENGSLRSKAGRTAGRGGGAGGGRGLDGGVNWRSDREKRALQVQLMRERVAQLKRAVEEGRLKPIANRLFQVRLGMDGWMVAGTFQG